MAAVARLHRLAFFNAMPQMPVLHTAEEDLAFYATRGFPNSEIWLSECDGSLSGFIAFRAAWVHQLYVHPHHQGCGLGTALLDIAKTAQLSIRLWTFQCNARARKFYEHQGFRIERETDGAENEEKQPDVLYVWERKISRDDEYARA
ncbi:GNAT family N-acetyltransferase [Luteolibacter sp. Populi]|uniref:GNAT family N-acetyltransferase n=1 Tax=Luteolibacter sp. Populi TaxID=3230487 RepID=UPI003467228E